MKKTELKELYQMMFPNYPDIVTVKQLQVCRDFQTAYLSLRRVQSDFCAEFQPTKILLGVQSKGSPKAEKRERKKAPSGQLGVLKCPIYKGFFEPNRG